MAQGDPYRLRLITGDAEPTMTRPKAHSTTVRRAIAGAVPSFESRPSRGARGSDRVALAADLAGIPALARATVAAVAAGARPT